MVGKTLDYEAKRIRDNNMMGKLQAEIDVYAELVEDRMLPIGVEGVRKRLRSKEDGMDKGLI